MIEKFVAVIYLDNHPMGFDMSPEFSTYLEALEYIETWSENPAFKYGMIEERIVKGEAQQTNPLDESGE